MGSFIIILVYFPRVSEIMAKYFNLRSVLNILPLFHEMQLEFFVFDSTYVKHLLASYKPVKKCNTYNFNQN